MADSSSRGQMRAWRRVRCRLRVASPSAGSDGPLPSGDVSPPGSCAVRRRRWLEGGGRQGRSRYRRGAVRGGILGRRRWRPSRTPPATASRTTSRASTEPPSRQPLTWNDEVAGARPHDFGARPPRRTASGTKSLAGVSPPSSTAPGGRARSWAGLRDPGSESAAGRQPGGDPRLPPGSAPGASVPGTSRGAGLGVGSVP